MKVTDVEVRVGVTVNIGNYESVRLDYSVRGTLDENETAEAGIDKGREYLKKKIADDLKASNGGKTLLHK